jgi:hypothetical protein
MADLIDRDKLIGDLKLFKIHLGDIIFGFVVDRVIEQVKAQPAAEVKVDNIAMIDIIEHTHSGLLEED